MYLKFKKLLIFHLFFILLKELHSVIILSDPISEKECRKLFFKVKECSISWVNHHNRETRIEDPCKYEYLIYS